MASESTRDAGSGQPPPPPSEKTAPTGRSSDAAAPSPSLPSVSVPKGGGAIRGIGEKFDAHPTTGTGSMHVPVATSPGRSGFGPQLSLAYDSGTGNGPFGLGWSLSLPSITRKTDKGLPLYGDGIETDVFILSGAEDLVPVLTMQNGRWSAENLPVRTVAGVQYRVQRYRPRIENPFSRIERWTNLSDPAEISWRSISQENVTTWYGKTAESRISDPANPQRTFTWLVCESSDNKGNVMVYEYKREDAAGVPMTQANERNRTRTANLYPKHIRYGNRTPYLPAVDAPLVSPPSGDNWYFDVVFDYGDLDSANPLPGNESPWPVRNDPFSTYRSGFEIRTYRLCQRVLMFHNFPGEPDVGNNCLVHSTDLTYSYEENPTDARNPNFSIILSVAHTGYRQNGTQGYLSSSTPPVEFGYSEAHIQTQVRDFDAGSLANLPEGVDGTRYQWTDLDGEGLSGILAEQAGAWFYKRNQSPLKTVVDVQDGTVQTEANFGPVEIVPQIPGLAFSSPVSFMDLGGDGSPDAVQLEDATPGFFTRTDEGQWEEFAPFQSLPNVNFGDPNLKFVDLNGDGLADVLITEGEALTWYPSLGRDGFGPSQRVGQPWDEERGPVVLFADGEQSVYLADMSGDGLSDLVRIRNGDVCYWPNIGYGSFGAKVAMDNAPWFDNTDQFNQQRVRLGDIDGSGTTDILYLHAEGVHAYFNQSGNSWSAPTILDMCPVPDNVTGVQVVDLLGNGTSCIVWSSPLAGEALRPIRYLDLMGGQKPHLLVSSRNNLGAETRIQYAPSTKFYLADKLIGKPWVTKLPFPVHVVERVETYDHISHTHFVTRYAYHHGYFDGVEREFRGFGMVEQWDTEQIDELGTSASFSDATNLDVASHVPPVLTRSWFHTGAFLKGQEISRQFAHEYYREDGLTDANFAAESLEDTVLPTDLLHTDGTRSPYSLVAAELQEACRALKGSMLRQETYALDRTESAGRPYAVSEQNHTVELLQAQAEGNRHAVFLVHPRESLDFHYERTVVVNAAGQQRADPRMSHSVTLQVDAFGNALRSLAISYPRRGLVPGLPAEQTATHITLTANRFANQSDQLDWYRVSLPVETRSYELVKPAAPLVTSSQAIVPFRYGELAALVEGLFPLDQDEPAPAKTWPYENWDWRTNSAHAPPDSRLRLTEHGRVLYRRDDLSGPVPLGQVESMALPYETYKLAFTQGLLAGVLQRSKDGQPPEALLPNPAAVLTGKGGDQGGYVTLDGDGWWLPSGRLAYSPTANFANPAATSAAELAEARAHFFLLRKHSDTFGQISAVSYTYDMVVAQMQDAVGNTTSAVYDYRVIQPSLVTDANGNRTAVDFDALGMVTATALMGSAAQASGDVLDEIDVDPPLASLRSFILDPRGQAASLLGNATTRIVYNLDRFRRAGQPVFAVALARETYVGVLQPGQATKIQINFTYSDGFGRTIQTKKLGEQGMAPQRQPPVVLPSGDIGPGSLTLDATGHPVQVSTTSRWVGDGRTVYNNKGKPVRQYEPFFSSTHLYEDEAEMTDNGVSSVLFYDPLDRVVGILHPNHTWEKVVFDPWQHAVWDVNDTVLVADPKDDPDVGDFFRRLHDTEYLPTWTAQRQSGALGSQEQDAARKVAIHANTPTIVHADSLGRTFLTVAHNKFKYADASASDSPTEEFYNEQTVLDIEGNHRKAVDANGRTVIQYDYDMLGNRLHQAGMEAGDRWILRDAANNPIRTWDSRGHMFRAEYDVLRRPIRSFVMGADDTDPTREVLTERLVYGEQNPDANPLLNMRGKIFLQFDQAGVVTHEAYDFRGNELGSSRRLAKQYKGLVSWSVVDGILPTDSTARIDGSLLEATIVPLLEADKHTSRRTFDALNRPVTVSLPDNTIIRSGFNEAALLNQLNVNLQATQQPDGQPFWTPFVANIEYDAKGQRQLIDYANGVRTTYDYDPLTFRLVHLLSRRTADAFASDCPKPPLADWPGCQVQSLFYSYDPVGNVTYIRDDAQQILYFRNKRVEPSADYTYDATYRLIEATGREHLGQAGGAPTPSSFNDSPRVGVPFSASDGNAMARYLERYMYDMVGNFQKVIHRGSDATVAGWTRSYTYSEASQLEPSRKSNRLTSTTTGTTTENYRYDVHGNTTAMPHLTLMQWNHHDQLEATSTQTTNNGNVPETTWYVYDAGGQRVRKVIERQATATPADPAPTPTRKSERIYLSGGIFELFRKYTPNNSETISLSRSTLHIADDKRRIALVETRTQGDEPGQPAQRTRFQLSNHLGSSSLELDETAQILSYEEYTPFGSTSYQMVQSQTEVPKKRYRYTGKERDKETGFYYHGARYYAPWLGRWISPDPAGLVDGANLYAYVQNSPLTMSDPTGLWGWREVAVVAAVVVVGTVVTVATAGAAAPLVGAAVGAIGLTGGAATLATGVAVGAVAGAVGGAAAGAAGEGTRQAVNGESLDMGKIGSEAGKGALVGGAIGAAVPLVTAGVTAAAGTTAGTAVVGAVGRIGGQAAKSGAARALVAGGKAVAQQPGIRQAISGARSAASATARGLEAIGGMGESAGNKLLAAGSRARPPPVVTEIPAVPKPAEAPAPASAAPPTPAAAEAPAPLGGDAPYSAREWREAMENRYGATNVESTTVPPAGAKNVRLAGRAHSQGTVYDQRGFPIFDDVAKADLRMSGTQMRSLSYKAQMRAATRELRDVLQANPALRSRFTPQQLKAIQSGKAEIPGLTWHHHQDVGRMQLIPHSVHSKVGHIGGDAMWGGK